VFPRLPHAIRRLVAELVIADRERRGSDFSNVRLSGDRIRGFDDLAFLFSSTILAHGIASLRLDEGAYLYRLVVDFQPRTAVEIGRFRGGSTFLLAAGLEHGILHSYDLETRQGRDGSSLDRQLIEALERYGLGGRVRLHVGDSGTADQPELPVDLLFVDGDHRETGVRTDFERWAPLVRPGGHLLFHDAIEVPDLVRTDAPGVVRVAAEVGDAFESRPAAGSLAHFVRRGVWTAAQPR
jgi:predicted O-methyltransferase YrrM